MKVEKPGIKVTTSGEIPLEGTLGLLAYGYRGIMAWRQVRHEHAQGLLVQFQNLTPKKAKSQDEKN